MQTYCFSSAQFTVTLPKLIEAANNDDNTETGRTSKGRAAKPKYKDLTNQTILIVDDEPDLLDLICTMLSNYGAKCLVATNASIALAILKQEKPNLIISDIGMPEIDGYEFIHLVRQLPDTGIANTPAIALTAYTRNEDRIRALNAGFSGYMSKPINAFELFENIVKYSH